MLDGAGTPATSQRCIAPFVVFLDLDLSGTGASPADYDYTEPESGGLTQVRLAACQASETVTVTVSATTNEVREGAAKTVVFAPRVTNARDELNPNPAHVPAPDTALHKPATLEIRDATTMPAPAAGQIWSGWLTAADLGSGTFGLGGGDGSLSDDDFAFRSPDAYTVGTLSIGGGTLSRRPLTSYKPMTAAIDCPTRSAAASISRSPRWA